MLMFDRLVHDIPRSIFGYTISVCNQFNEAKLVLHTVKGKAYGDMIWQSFDSPTDTLLPNQALTRERRLVASRSRTNYSSGFYKLIFSDDNILSLVFNGLETDSVYWPDNSGLSWEAWVTSYNETDSSTAEWVQIECIKCHKLFQQRQ